MSRWLASLRRRSWSLPWLAVVPPAAQRAPRRPKTAPRQEPPVHRRQARRAPQVRCGFGRRNGRTLAFICQLGGTAHPSGFRTARRVLALAERLRIPVLILIDTSGADNSTEGELLGIGTSIAEVLQQFAATTVPILSVVVGQGVSGRAIALVNPEKPQDGARHLPRRHRAGVRRGLLYLDATEVPAIAERLSLCPADLVGLGVAQGTLS